MAEPDDESGQSHVRVLVRVRPTVEREAGGGLAVTVKDQGGGGKGAIVDVQSRRDGGTVSQFRFDHVLAPEAKQANVYSLIQHCVPDVLCGVNNTVFAYGQTGSGKTHTMLGDGLETMLRRGQLGGQRWGQPPDDESWGLVPRAVHHLFSEVARLSRMPAAEAAAAAGGGEDEELVDILVTMSYLQLYNGAPYDLLAQGGPPAASKRGRAGAGSVVRGPALDIREGVRRSADPPCPASKLLGTQTDGMLPAIASVRRDGEAAAANGHGGSDEQEEGSEASGDASGGSGGGKSEPHIPEQIEQDGKLAGSDAAASSGAGDGGAAVGSDQEDPSPKVSAGRVMDGSVASKYVAGGASVAVTGGEATGSTPAPAIFLPGLAVYSVRSLAEVMGLLRIGSKNRAVRSTQYNAVSSRSHAILQLDVTAVSERPVHDDSPDDGGGRNDKKTKKAKKAKKKRAADPLEEALAGGRRVRRVVRRGRLCFVDLAGSERWDVVTGRAAATNGGAAPETLPVAQQHQRELELRSINSSLSALTRCIAALAEKSKAATAGRAKRHVHIPYRSSILTRLLQDSLGGNSKTQFLTTITPSMVSVEETVSTLRIATRAKDVCVKVRKNEVVDPVILLARARKEISRLRKALRRFIATYGGSMTGPDAEARAAAAAPGIKLVPLDEAARNLVDRRGGGVDAVARRARARARLTGQADSPSRVSDAEAAGGVERRLELAIPAAAAPLPPVTARDKDGSGGDSSGDELNPAEEAAIMGSMAEETHHATAAYSFAAPIHTSVGAPTTVPCLTIISRSDTNPGSRG